jgi:hypothetical protein
MKRAKMIAVAAVAVIAAGAAMRGCGASPDERIAARLQGVCDLARANVDAPARGVQRLFTFLDDHTADTMRDLAALVVEVQRIADPSRHESRARQANRVMHAPLAACASDLERFSDAVAADEEASRMLDAGFERLERTINLLFGSSAHTSARAGVAFDLRTLLDPRAWLAAPRR